MTRLLLKMAQNIYKLFQFYKNPYFRFWEVEIFSGISLRFCSLEGQEQTCKDVSFHPEVPILLQDDLCPDYPGDAR